ncbi:hypothetical protein WAF17_21110 [Bernardetia sp. ABR2-2B]|uniref:hypothetical protein n=1 Tax=Bernardetia sp. ABR2-2B TaxID=3127472 RepID=UPI0030CCAB28
MYITNFNEREIELLKKSLESTLDVIREANNKTSKLDLDFHKKRKAKNNQMLNLIREYEDVLIKIEKAD